MARGSKFTIMAVAEGAISKEDAKLSKKEYKEKMKNYAHKDTDFRRAVYAPEPLRAHPGRSFSECGPQFHRKRTDTHNSSFFLYILSLKASHPLWRSHLRTGNSGRIVLRT